MARDAYDETKKKNVYKQPQKKTKKTVVKKPQSSSVSKPGPKAQAMQRMTDTSTGRRPAQTQKPASTARQQQTTRSVPAPGRAAQNEYKARQNAAPKTAQEMREEREKKEKAKKAAENVTKNNTSSYYGGSMQPRQTKFGKSAADTVEQSLKQAGAAENRMFWESVNGITDPRIDPFYNNVASKEEAEKGQAKIDAHIESAAKKIEDSTAELERIKQKHGWLGQRTLEAISSGVGMLTDYAWGPAALAHMFIRSTGTARGQVTKQAAAMRQNLESTGLYTEDELDEMFKDVEKWDMANAMANGGIEMASERLFTGAGLAKKAFGPGIIDRAAGRLFGKFAGRTTSGFLGRLALGTAEEITEEEVGGPLQVWAANQIYGKKLQAMNEDASRRALKVQSDNMLAQVQNESQARYLASQLSSQDFYDETSQSYIDAGFSKEDSDRLSSLTVDYLTASLTSDTDAMQTAQDEMVSIMTSGDKSMLEKWTLKDAVDVAVSTGIMTSVSGLQGSVSTAQQGKAARMQLGADGVRNLAEVTMNWDTDNSDSAKAVLDRLDNGNDITDTQVAEYVSKASRAALESQQDEDAKWRTADARMKAEDLRIAPAQRAADGSIVLLENTERRYDQILRDALDRYQDSKSEIGTEQIELGADLAAAQMTGVITAEQINELAKAENKGARQVFQDVTGIDLEQFNKYDRHGLKIAETNIAMRKGLFASAAENIVESARAEQEAWNDEARQEMSRTLRTRMEGSGAAALDVALQNVDPRDRDAFRLTGAVARDVYRYARTTLDDWNTAKRKLNIPKGVNVEDLKGIYDAAKADKAKAENKYHGKAVKAQEEMKRHSLDKDDPAYVPGKFENESAERTLDFEQEKLLNDVAVELEANVVMTDSLSRGENGRYDYKTRTIMLNSQNTMGENLKYIFSHEVTHHLAVYAPEEYLKLSRFIMDRWYKQNPAEYTRQINGIKELYKARKDQDLTDEEALEELIADGTKDFWHDEAFATKITQEEPSLAKAIINSIKNILTKLRNILAHGNIRDEATRNGFFDSIDAYDTAYSLWLDAYNAARKGQAQQAIDEWQENANTQNEVKYSVAEQKWENGEKLSKAKFNGFYSAHKLNYGRANESNIEEVIEAIKRDGFISTTAISNVLPASINDYINPERLNDTQARYAARKGDVVMLVPNKFVDMKSDIIKSGYIPRDYEIVKVERDFQPYYELYSEAYDESTARFSISETDSEGNTLSEGQRRFFKNSKAVDETGRLIGFYHGTPSAGFTEFDKSGFRDHDGWFFTDRRDVAESYMYGDKGGVYAVYLNLTNPMVIDAEGQDWTNIQAYTSIEARDRANEIDSRLDEIRDAWQNGTDNGEYDALLNELDELDSELSGGDTDSWVSLAKERGHDGLIVRNILDYGENYSGEEYEPFTEAIAFEKNQIKRTDNLNPTEDGDTRYSLPAETVDRIEHEIGPDVRFSVPTYRQVQAKAIYKTGVGYSDYYKNASGRELTYELTKKNFSEEQAKAVVSYMDKMAAWFEQTGKGSLKSRFRFIGWDDLTSASVQVKKNDAGDIIGVTVSAMVKNGEYPVNFDLTTVCNKREGITKVIKNLMDTQVEGESVLNSIKLTDANMWKINQALKAEGIDTACLGCFVEARRYYAQNFMDKIEDKWNSAVRKARRELGLPEDEYFDFTHGRQASGEEWSSIDSLWTAYDESSESKSSPADRIKILMDEIVKNKDVDSPYLKQIRIADILTPEGINGFKQLSNKGHDMVKTIKSIYGTSAPKEILAFTPYNSEIALLPEQMKGMDTPEYLKSIGGIRVQSFSDFKIEHTFEHMQMVADEASRGFYTHGYSKVIAFPRIFGLTGRKINMSVMFDVLPNKAWSQALGIPVKKAAKYAKKYQGLQFVKELPKENKDNRPYREIEIEGVHGYLTYLVSDADYVNSIYDREYAANIAAGMTEEQARRAANNSKPYEQSINYSEAAALENEEGYKENVGIIAVAYGDEHLKMLMSDPNVRYIIPYHKSGLPTFISKKTALAIARDYTKFQNTNIAESWKDAKGKDVDLKAEYAKFKKDSKSKYPAIDFFKQINDNKYKVKFGSKDSSQKAEMAGTADFDVYAPLETASDIREVSNAYLEHCIEKGWCPIFHEFAGDPNYYKMLFDFAVTDGSFTNIFPQRQVRNRYPGLDIDAKVAAGEEITEQDLAKLKEEIIKGADTQNNKNMTMSNNMGNVMNDILTRGSENSIIDDTNLQSIRWGTPDYTDVKLGNEEAMPEETNDDIRLSLAVNYDEDYMDAVNSGDMEEAQRLVDEAAKEAGYKELVYHGTGEYFNEFRLGREGIHLGNIEQAEQVARNRYHDRSRETRYKWGEIKDRISEMDTETRQSLINRLERTSAHAPIFDGDISDAESVKAYAEDALQKYYGTQTDINNKSVLMRTFDRNVGENVMRMYARLDNPFVINGDILDWTPWNIAETLLRKADGNTEYRDDFTERIIDISGSDLNLGKWTRKAVEQIANGEIKGDEAWRLLDGVLEQAGGYHGIKYLNQFEGDKNSYSYIALNRSDVKLADPVTYAEDGSVIPLSERFDPENNDIRYSLATQDSDGKILSDGQMEFFKNSKARKKGRLVPVYHATNKGGFTVFDPMKSDDHRSLFFASNWDVAQTYGEYANSRFYYFDIDNIDDVRKYLDAYSPDRYFLTQEQFDQAGGWEADFLDFENITKGKQSDFDNYLENPDKYIAIIGVPDYSPDNTSYADTWVMAKSSDELVRELHNHFGWQRDNYRMGTQHGYYACYLNIENPLIIDANGQYWDSISVGELPVEEGSYFDVQRSFNNGFGIILNGSNYVETGKDQFEIGRVINEFFGFDEYAQEGLTLASEVLSHFNISSSDMHYGEEELRDVFASTGILETQTTRGWAKIAEEQGYDGVIIRNVVDIGGKSDFDGIDELSDIYIAFKAEQIKDINNENPTENPDIRYALADDEDVMSVMQTYATSTDDLWSNDPIEAEGRVRHSLSKKDFINGITDVWRPEWKTEGKILKEKAVENSIREVIMGAMRNSNTTARYRKQVVDDTMLVARKAYNYMKNDDWTKAGELLYEQAHNIIDNLEFFGAEEKSELERYKNLRAYLRHTKITVPKDKRSDIDYQAYRKKNYGKILLGNNGTAPDVAWQHLNELWPEVFTEDIKGDIPGIMMALEAAVEVYKPVTYAYTSEECEDFAGDIANALWEILYEGEAYKSLADRFDERSKAMKQRHQEAMRKVRENYKEKLTQQALEAKRSEYEKLTAQKEKLTDRYEKKISDIKENQAEKDAARKYRAEHRRLYDRVLKEYKDLTNRLLHPVKDKTKNIPEQIRQPLAEMLYCFDLEKETSKRLEELHMLPTRTQLNFRQLKDSIEQVIKEDPTAYEFSDIHKFLKDKMTDIADRVDGKGIDALENEDIEVIKDLLTGLNAAIRNYQQVEVDGEKYQAQQMCEKVGEAAAEHRKLYGPSKKYNGVITVLNNIVNMGELTPVYFFQEIGGMYDMYRQIRKGFDNYVRNEQVLVDKLADILKPFYKTNRKGQQTPGSEIEEWRHTESAETYDLTYGPLRLTVAQKMSLYCLAKRAQAKGHMLSDNGGVVASESTAGKMRNRLVEGFKGKFVDNQQLPLTPADIDSIVSTLTPEQKEVADALQRLMSEDMAKLGNEASVKLTGVEMYKEDNYFPIKILGDTKGTDLDNIGMREKVRNPGFSNPLVENASNPIILDDIFTVVASHCNEMNLYASYAVPLTAFMKVYNGSILDENGKTVKVKQILRRTYGDKAITYIENFLDDINGNSFKRQGGLDDVLDKALGQAKKAAVFANLRVAAQQPTAIVRAAAVLNPKYFKGVRPSVKATKEMIEHCPIAQWKAWGYYDTHFGRSIEDVMMGRNVSSKMDKLMSDIYGQLDNMTWGMIWQAVKNEIRATHKGIDENSQEFWDLCSERASYVFDTTQVVDSPFHRSNDMRSKNGMVKQLTSFQAEPTLSFNVLRKGILDTIDALKKGDKAKAGKVLARVLGVWIGQAITVAFAQSLVDALRRKGHKKEDDEEDEALAWYQEMMKYFQRNWWGNLSEGVNPIYNIYFIKEIVPAILNAIEGEYVYGSTNLTFQWVDTLTNGITQVKKKWEKGDAYSKTWYDCFTELLGGIGYFFGIPAKTMMRGTKNAFHWANKIFGMNVFADDGSADKAFDNIIDNFRKEDEDDGEGKTKSKSKGDSDSADESEALTDENLKEHIEQGVADADETFKKRSEKAAEKAEGKTGRQRDQALWDVICDGYTNAVESGNMATIYRMRSAFAENGGDVEWFDSKITEKMKGQYKKTIGTEAGPGASARQEVMRDYLLEHGVSEAEISDICYHSATAKDLKAALRMGNEEYIIDELTPLIRAGLTYEDFEKLYKYRNYGAQNYDGKYTDPKYKMSTGSYIWPTDGVISSGFGYRSAPTAGASTYHQGIDIAAPQGTPVVACDGGVVIEAGYNGGYGNSVGIRHDDGTISYYNHLYAWNVQEGDHVGQGQQIGQVGSTGVSTGPHLDFRLYKDGDYLNPEEYLNKKS